MYDLETAKTAADNCSAQGTSATVFELPEGGYRPARTSMTQKFIRKGWKPVYVGDARKGTKRTRRRAK